MCALAKTTTGRFEEKATVPKGVRSSGEISYDISALKDYRNELTEELFQLNNGTGRYTEEGAARVTEIESALADLRKTETSLDAELKQANQAETQTLIDSGEYRKANFKDVTVNAFNQGRYNAKYGQESYKDMRGQENEKETYAQILADEDYKYLPQSRAAKLVSGVSGQLGQMFHQLSDPRTLNTGIAGAATGTGLALIAGQAGPQVLLPEEVLTVPGGMAAGFFTGIKAGSAEVNFEIEAGLAYNELLANGVSEKTARNIALGVGGANAALELVQLDELTDAFKITQRTGATKNAAKVLAEEIVKRTGGVAKETAQEVLQEGVTTAGVQMGTKLDTGKWAYDTKEVAQRLWDTGTSAAVTFGVLNTPSTMIDIAAMRQQLIDRQRQQSMDELAAEYEKNVGSHSLRSEGLDALNWTGYDEHKEADLYGRREETSDVSRIYGADVRDKTAEADTGRANTYQEIDSGNDTGREAADWARGHIIEDTMKPASAAVAEGHAKDYYPDVYVVEDAALKARRPNAWATTSEGMIYISDALPEELANVVGYHEVVHAARQQGVIGYQDFLNTVGERIDLKSDTIEDILEIILSGRFQDKGLFELNANELKLAYDELNAVIWGYYKADPDNARAQFVGVFKDYDSYIAELDAIMEEFKISNWGQWDD